MKKLLSILYFSILMMLLFSVTAFAYIDPSAMTYIIQIIAGVAIAAGAALGFYMRRIKRFFSKRKKSAEPDDLEYDLDDDDDEGYDDYEMDEDDYEISDNVTVSPKKEPAVAHSTEKEAYSYTVEIPSAEETISIPEPAPDPYDEGSSRDMLLHENRELRRLLAIEREKVAILKKSLHICTENTK